MNDSENPALVECDFKSLRLLGYKKDAGMGGYVVAPDDSESESEVDALWIDVLGGCGCGSKEIALAYVRNGLRHIHDLKELVWEDKQTHAEWAAAGRALLGGAGGMEFFHHWADSKKLTEHGGCVPGWLTPLGLAVMDDLKGVEDDDGPEAA